MSKLDDLRLAKKVIEDSKFPNVQAIGIGYKTKGDKRTKELSIVVYVKDKVDESKLLSCEIIPKTLTVNNSTVKTDVVKSGEIKLLRRGETKDTSGYGSPTLIQELTDRVRPLVPGHSIGHEDITAGTLGCFVKHDGKLCILSNNHVLANVNRASIGDPILQPGKHDGGTSADKVATLKNFIHIDMLESNCPIFKAAVKTLNWFSWLFGRKSRIPNAVCQISNLVDCAIAEVDSGVGAVYDVPFIGQPTGLTEAEVGMQVRKTGRTTEYMEGEITAIEATVNVNMGVGTAIFTDQIITTYISAGGDSGSAIFDEGTNLVALLFAGSNTITIGNKIQNVFDKLEIELP